MIVPIPYVHAGLGILTAILSLPLILKKVPMNRAYGIRVRKAFASQDNWYVLNAFGGKLLLACGLFLVVFSLLSQGVAPPPVSPWAPVFLIAPLLVFVPVVLLINAFARRLPDL
jgi:uncharacterized membrane protein